jgi:hypothetical protein
MIDPHSLFSLNDHLEAQSRHGDPLDVLVQTLNFEYFPSMQRHRSQPAAEAAAPVRVFYLVSKRP